MRNGTVSGAVVTMKDAYAQAMTVFKDKETRLKYDEALKMKRFEPIADFVGIAGSNGKLDRSIHDELIEQAMNEGLSMDDAERRLNQLCDEKNITILTEKEKTKTKLNMQQCGFCGLVNHAKGSSCIRCGHPLTVTCKKCKSKSPSSAEYCSHCGTSLIGLLLQEDLLRKAELAISKKNFEHAEELVEKARYFWKNNDDVKKMKQKIINERNQMRNQINKIEELIKD